MVWQAQWKYYKVSQKQHRLVKILANKMASSISIKFERSFQAGIIICKTTLAIEYATPPASILSFKLWHENMKTMIKTDLYTGDAGNCTKPSFDRACSLKDLGAIWTYFLVFASCKWDRWSRHFLRPYFPANTDWWKGYYFDSRLMVNTSSKGEKQKF